MAEKRMFSKQIIDSDAFLDMPLSAQALYFHLSMRADDDGFVNNPQKITRVIGAAKDDLGILLAKNFILTFESGVIVIKHWRINNYLRSDRYKETVYQDEKEQLEIKENGAYTLNGIPMVDQRYTQNSIEESRVDKISIEKNREDTEVSAKPSRPSKHKHGEFSHVLLTDEEFDKLQIDFDNADDLITYLDEYKEMKGVSYKSDYLAIRKWVVNAVKEKNRRNKDTSELTYDERLNQQIKEMEEDGLL